MNRRGFFKALGATGLVATIPTAVVMALRESSAMPAGIVFKRRSELMDWETKMGLAAQLDIGDDRYRHAILMPIADWDALTPTQKERTWKLVERKTYEFAMKRRKS